MLHKITSYVVNWHAIPRHWYILSANRKVSPGARPTNHVSIEFEILKKMLFITYKAGHNEILHTPRLHSKIQTGALQILIEIWIRSKYR